MQCTVRRRACQARLTTIIVELTRHFRHFLSQAGMSREMRNGYALIIVKQRRAKPMACLLLLEAPCCFNPFFYQRETVWA
jgi:hypothetical protein